MCKENWYDSMFGRFHLKPIRDVISADSAHCLFIRATANR